MRKGLLVVVVLAVVAGGIWFGWHLRGDTGESASKSGERSGSKVLLPVLVDGKWGYINRTGEMVIRPQFVYAHEFYEGLAAVCCEQKRKQTWGYIEPSGKVVVPPQFLYGQRFSEGLAAVYFEKREKSGWGYIDKSGRIVIETDYSLVSDFEEGLAYVVSEGSPGDRWGFIDKTGKVVAKPQFSDILGGFREGRAMVGIIGNAPDDIVWYEGLGWGVIDEKGHWVVKPTYSEVRRFNEGLAPVQFGIQGQWGFIDRSGKLAIPATFTNAGSFSEGLAPVEVASGGYRSYGYTDSSGKLAYEQRWDPYWGDAEFGFIDRTGKIVIGPRFDLAEPFSEGLACVRDEKGMGYIDKTGRVVFRVKADSEIIYMEEFIGGIGVDHRRAGCQIIDKQGRLLSPRIFKEIDRYKEGYAGVWTHGGSFGYMDNTGKWIWKPRK